MAGLTTPAIGNMTTTITGGATETKQDAILAELQLKADLTETQPVSAASLPLPSGAATAANQLADGHNVTVDNASAAAAVNIQDGGNTITVDGTVTANATLAAETTKVIGTINVAAGQTIAVTNAGTFAVQDSQDIMLGTDFSNVFGAASLISVTPAVKVEQQGTVTVDLGVNNDVTLATLPDTTAGDLATINSNTDSLAVVGGGAEATAVRVTIANNSTGVISVDDNGGAITVDGSLTSAGNVTNAGTFVVQVDGSALTALQLIDDSIYIDDADWTADTSSHTLVGAVTQVATTANTDGDVTPLTTNAFRELRTAIPESDLATAGTAHVKKYYTSAGAVTDGIIWSPAAGKRWYVTDIFINVSAAATVTLEDDLGAGDSAVWKAELAANSGWSHSFTTPLYSGEDAADLLITTSAGNVYVTVTGYEI